MVIMPRVGAVAGGYGSAYTESDSSSLVSGIGTAVADALKSFSGQSGDIVIPVYVGGTLLDEMVVTAQTRQNLRSGGR